MLRGGCPLSRIISFESEFFGDSEKHLVGWVETEQEYKAFRISSEGKVEYGDASPKKNYRNYSHFVGVQGKFDPYQRFLESPIPLSDFSYSYLLEVKRKFDSIQDYGGTSSGNFGHAGRPGKTGGSAPTRKLRKDMTKEEKAADIARTTAEKWARNGAFISDHDALSARISKDFDTSEEAKVLYLIDQTGFRVGGERIRGKNQVFGASTLRPDHIKLGENGQIGFYFLGKKSVQQDHEIMDQKLADVLSTRLNQQRLFNSNSDKVLDYLKGISNNKYLVKDFRTYVATDYASALVQSSPKPTTTKQKKALVKQICTDVSKVLGNTPGMAKGAYINPVVWKELE